MSLRLACTTDMSQKQNNKAKPIRKLDLELSFLKSSNTEASVFQEKVPDVCNRLLLCVKLMNLPFICLFDEISSREVVFLLGAI